MIERHPRQPVERDEHDDGGVDHQPVGERVRDLAELRLDVPAPRQVAVELVGDRRERRRRCPAGQLGPLRSSSSSQTKSGIAAKRISVSAFGICRTGAETVRVRFHASRKRRRGWW